MGRRTRRLILRHAAIVVDRCFDPTDDLDELLQLGGIDYDVFDLGAFPSVRNVDQAILGLNDRGITELALLFFFQVHQSFPGLAVG